MNARLIKLCQDLQSSYYFIPGLMAIAAVILAVIMSQIDKSLDYDTLKELGWFYSNKADGARAILTTIAGSMITVAGVTFSMTMVAVSSAAAQYGPRLIGNFMRDRANQFTLGAFTATFIYCLLILRVARSGDSDNRNAQDAIVEFVPNLSLLMAIVLALASVGVLIFFIHHVPETLNVARITSRVGSALRKGINAPFPASIGSPYEGDGAVALNQVKSGPVEVIGTYEGYVQAIDGRTLMDIANEHNLVINIQYSPGDFVVSGDVIAHFYICDTGDAAQHMPDEMSDKLMSDIRVCFAQGQERTAHQNALFLADELVEILARALSPGVNDPYTAINCMNWFRSVISAYDDEICLSQYRANDQGELRVIAHPLTFSRLTDVILARPRGYIACDRNAALKMLSVMGEAAARMEKTENRDLILKEMSDLKEACDNSLSSTADKADIARRYESARRMAKDKAFYKLKINEQGWIGGRG